MKILLLLAMMAAGTAVRAQTPYDLSDGRDLQALCEANTKDSNLNALAHTFCMGYIRGVAEQAGLIKSAKACVPRGVSDEDMKKAVSRFLQQHPKYMQEKATTVVSAAVQAAFHCR
jgi:hypothetical protein